jgi:aminoglycoside phosphotransferase (APT) family kinase protein
VNNPDAGLVFPPSALPWIEQVGGGPVSTPERMVVRREAWRAQLAAPGGPRDLFLRIDRASAAGKPYSRNLSRETSLISWLASSTTIPTQKILGWNDEHCVAIQSFEPGRADLNNAPREEQHAVMLHFMEILADLHRIDVHALDLPGFEMPATPEEHSLLELRAVEDPRLARFAPDASSVLSAFGQRWLLNHVPRSVERTVLLQGDTGPGNFMFLDGRVTAVVDWEWAHYGDPMEDIGNLWLRDFFTPSCGGDLTPYVRHYAEHAGVTLDRQKAIYYFVHQLVRSVMTIPGLTRRPDWKSTVALNLGYQALCDITCCEAIGLWHGLQEQPTEPLPIVEGSEAGELYQTLATQLEKGVAPKVTDPFAATMASGAAGMVRYLERLHLFGPQADALELEGIRQLLGSAHDSLEPARRALIAATGSLDAQDELALLRHSWGVARRNMQLMGPLVERWNWCRVPRLD